MADPQPFLWAGDAMIPLRPRSADKQFVIGQEYILVEQEDRSPASHRAYFASVGEVFKTLPDDMADRFVSADHLRKEALKAPGWCDTQTEVCSSNAEARRWAERIRKYMPSDAFPTITIAGCAVVVIVARSQKVKAMNKADFQASSQAVLKFLAEHIGVPVSALPQHEAA